jgi:multidrug efflux system membrane fusion protein
MNLNRFVIPLLAGLFFLGACSKADKQGKKGPPPVPVQVAQVARKDVPVDLKAIGNVEPVATVAIKPQVTGELKTVHFNEGDEVEQGALLFTIDPTVYEAQLAQAEANLARNRAQAANAQRELARNEELGKKGAVSREQLDQTRAAAEALEAAVRADEAATQMARVQLGYTTIRAPISGRTGALNVKAGNLVKSGSDAVMVTLNQIAPIFVTFALPEQHLREIREGMAARELRVTALDPKTGQPLGEGRLGFISNSVDPTTGTILLKATFPNEDHGLWPGAFVDVTLHLATQPDAIVVPAEAITIGQSGQQLFVINGDTAELRRVEVTRTSGAEVVLANGVQPGETIVVNGQSRLIPGSRVIIKPAGDAATHAAEVRSTPTQEKERS